jgi:hypothetical protein
LLWYFAIGDNFSGQICGRKNEEKKNISGKKVVKPLFVINGHMRYSKSNAVGVREPMGSVYWLSRIELFTDTAR